MSKDHTKKSFTDRFTDFADAVSEAMGTPANISFWVFVVVAWFALFIFNPALQNSDFIPSWFTSTAFNFPLNTITTLAELYIGFLLAAASNRAQRALTELLGRLETVLGYLKVLDEAEDLEIKELLELQKEQTQLTREVHAALVKKSSTRGSSLPRPSRAKRAK